MPSGKTHDAITILLAVPAFLAAYAYTHSPILGGVVGAAFVFGGLMFGPDLDTVSRQYSRWLIFRFLWFPYRAFFKHRSRFSHGLVFGALIRVIYFMGVMTLGAFLGVLLWTGIRPSVAAFANSWAFLGDLTRTYFGENFLLFAFLGLWLGAASHTFTDMTGSFIKTGKLAKFL